MDDLKRQNDAAALVCKQLSKTFVTPSRRIQVLSRFSHIFNSGSLTVITGESGVGKSTLLALLASTERPAEGTISWGALQIQALSAQQRADYLQHHVGLLHQKARLLNDATVLENILLNNYLAGKEHNSLQQAMQLLDRYGITSLADELPSHLSGGQQQRIALACALIKKPAIILADEPTNHLDAESARIVINALREAANQGAIVIVATHDDRIISIADEQVLLRSSR